MHVTDSAYLPEIWTEYGVGTFILFMRFFVRLKTVGLKGFQGDDYFSLAVLLFWTVDAAMVHVVYYAGTNVEVLPSEVDSLTPALIAQLEFGGKCELVAWYSYTALIWCMKATMLFFFKRLTFGLWANRLVNWLAGVCVVSYLVVMLTVTFGCFPIANNWRVLPLPDLTCGLKKQNFIVTTVFNVVTDALILSIPVPLLWKLKIPVQRKLVIAILLCTGIFVITAAIIRVVFSLGSSPSSILVNEWGVRETLVGIVAINIPILRPMFNKTFWMGTYTPDTRADSPSGTNNVYQMSGKSVNLSSGRTTTNANTESSEHIVSKMEEGTLGSRPEVLVTSIVDVRHEAPSRYGDNWQYGGTSRVVVGHGSQAV